MLAPSIILAAAISGPGVAAGCERARDHYEALAFDAALAAAEGVDRPTALCFEVRGLVLLALGRRAEAEAALRALFERWPERAIDEGPLAPADRAFIARIRASVEPLRVEVTAGWLVHTALRLHFELRGGLRGARRVRFDAGVGADVATGVVPLVGRVATTTISVAVRRPPPAADAGRETLTVRYQVLDGGGRAIHGDEVRRGLAPRPPAPSVAEGDDSETGRIPWWVWTLGAVVVVSAGAATAIVLAQPGAPDASGTLGRREVP